MLNWLKPKKLRDPITRSAWVWMHMLNGKKFGWTEVETNGKCGISLSKRAGERAIKGRVFLPYGG